MESVLLYVVIAMSLSVVINLILKRLGISQIIGYIITGTIVAYSFDLHHAADSHALELLGEFGIVFLMFTIGLEISLARLGTMKKEVFGNGTIQVGVTAIIIYIIAHFLFEINNTSSIIIAMAFSLSSTAVVLTYLKESKEIYTPYGQRSMGILIFQDIAVIPILLLIGFLSDTESSVSDILINTSLSAIVLIGLLFVVGKRAMTWLLHFSAQSNEEELFLGSVLVIVMSASLFAHYMGFTYSLGAFVAGMIIAETRYHHKVESDIASFKNLLLGTFFVTVGMKINLLYFMDNALLVLSMLIVVLILKGIIIYFSILLSSAKETALKTALAISQVGEFSFAIFALAGANGLIESDLSQLLVLIVVSSMMITPFLITRITAITDWVFKPEVFDSNIETCSTRSNHVVVCGYSIVGRLVADELKEFDADYVVIDNSMKHVKQGLKRGEEIFYGDMSKPSILSALHVEEAAAVIVTLDNLEKKRLICETILKYTKNVNLIVKVVSLAEKNALRDLPINVIVDGKVEVARVLVERMLTCQLIYK